MKKENDLVNIIKFIACFFIVLLHVIDKYDPDNYLLELGRFGVPFFLMISGYYAYKSNKKDNLDNAKKQLFKVLKITLIILICYSLFNCINSYFINNHDPLYWITHHLNSKKALFKLLVFNRAYYICNIFWYFLALIYVYIIYYLLVKFNLLKYSYILIIPLIILSNIFGEFLHLEWYYSGNFLITGLPFFLLGNYLHAKKLNVNNLLLIITVLLSIIIYIFEVRKFGLCFMPISAIISSISLFILAINNKKDLLKNDISILLKKSSMYIFYSHCMIRDAIHLIYRHYHIEFSLCTKILLVMFASFVFSIIYIRLKELITNKRSQ